MYEYMYVHFAQVAHLFAGGVELLFDGAVLCVYVCIFMCKCILWSFAGGVELFLDGAVLCVSIYVCIYIYIYIYIYALLDFSDSRILRRWRTSSREAKLFFDGAVLCVYVCMYVCVYVYTFCGGGAPLRVRR